jgi:hypothetical protein
MKHFQVYKIVIYTIEIGKNSKTGHLVRSFKQNYHVHQILENLQ